jgi:thymidylate kinase
MPTTIFEGPDCAGKTTLARALAAAPGSTRLTAHGPYLGERGIARHYVDDLRHAIAMPGVHVILDRAWQSEPVYARAVRGKPARVSVAERRILERMAWSVAAVEALVIPPLELCAERWCERRGKEYVADEATYEKVWSTYDDLARAPARLRRVVVREPDPDPARVAASIELARPWANFGPGFGHFGPDDVALVVLSKGSVLDADDPAIAGLASDLEARGVPEGALYWVGARGPFGETLGAFLNVLRPRLVVALGEAAAGWCARRGLAATIELPCQSERRGEEPHPLGALLEKAL